MHPSNLISKLLTGFVAMGPFGPSAAIGAFALLSGFSAPPAAAQNDPELGFFHILSRRAHDNTVSLGSVSLDVESGTNEIDGFVHMRSPELGKDSQLWDWLPTDVLDDGGIRIILRSKKLPGLCLSRDAGGLATTRPCGDDNTLWDALPKGPSMYILQQPSSDGKLCLTADGAPAAAAPAHDCTPPKFFGDDMIWSLERLAVISQPSNSPSNPPSKPTGCKVFGAGGNCGLVGFNCNPLSAADTIVVTASAKIGITVTNLEPSLGLINGRYQNEGQASVAICALRAGMHACSDRFDVTFGPTVCSGSPPSFCPGTCPHGQIKCGCECKPPANCRHPQ